MNQKPQSDDGLDHLDIENFALSIAKESGKILFKNPQLKDVITTASANSNFTNKKDQ